MKNKSRLISFALVTLTAATLLLSTPKPAKALFIWTPYEEMVESMLTLINNNMETMSTTMLTISDDIGTMADRILIMADNIVETEILMADLVRDVTDAQGPSTLLTSPTEGELVDLALPMDITLSSGAVDYVLYLSNDAALDSATNIIITTGDSSLAIDRALSYTTGTQLYIAVKAINGDTMGPLSNTVMVNIIQ